MRVSDIAVESTADACELRAWVASDRDPDDVDWFAPFPLWYRFPGWCEPFLSAENGDPFLAALLVPAMRLKEPLLIPAPVSPQLLAALPRIQDVYAAFSPLYTRVPIEAMTRERPRASDVGGVGLFFSLGVDSFYSLLKNQRDHPHDTNTITHLISAHGFDVPFTEWDTTFPADFLANLRRVSAETGKALIPVVSNVRREAGKLAPWTMTHGGAMVSIPLALGNLLRRVTIAASTTYDRLYPWGTHPVLDPLWATERIAFVHDGCEINSIDKTAAVAQSPLVRATLRVCPGHGPGYNCGQCLKCLRTMIDLQLAGALDDCQTLPHTVDAERLHVALQQGGGPAHIADYRRRLEGLASSPRSAALRQVLSEHLALEEGGWIKTHATHNRGRRSRGGQLFQQFLGRSG